MLGWTLRPQQVHRRIARITSSLELGPLGVASWSIHVKRSSSNGKKLEIYWFLALQCLFSTSWSKRAICSWTSATKMFREFHETSIRKDVVREEVALTDVQIFIGSVWQVLSQHGGCLHFTVGRVQPCVAWLAKIPTKSQRWSSLIIFDILINADINLSKGYLISFTELDDVGCLFFLGGGLAAQNHETPYPSFNHHQYPWKWFAAETCSALFHWTYVLQQK